MITFCGALIWFFLIVFVVTVYWYLTIPKNLPPGPIGLPLVGSSFDYLNASTQPRLLQENVKKYGPLFKLYIANRLVVVLGDFDTIQEAFVKHGDVFAGRPKIFQLFSEEYLNHGLTYSDGDLWKEQRRFALTTLRNFGMGRPIAEARIKKELEHLIRVFDEKSSDGSSFDAETAITNAVSNVISAIIFGRRMSRENVDLFMSICASQDGGDGAGYLSPFNLIEKASLLLRYIPAVKQMQEYLAKFAKIVIAEVEKTMAISDLDSDPTNFIHAFMKAGQEQRGAHFDNIQLVATVYDLFLAGTVTTSTTMRWAILYLATYPHFQEKMFEEIKNEVGLGQLPNYADKSKLPFSEAVIMETQRLSDSDPLSLPRRTLEPVKLMGYDIPKDTVVVPLLVNVFHNPDVYPDPTRFDPYRFLDVNGKVYHDPKLIPFGSGKRICLGESLAKMELFLLLVGLISRFRFYFPSDQTSPTLKPVGGFIFRPANYRICIESRDD